MPAKFTYNPTGDKVLIIPEIETDRKTDSGLLIPDTAKTAVMKGAIFAAGQGVHAPETGNFIPNYLRKGDYVLFAVGAGMAVEIDTEEGRKEAIIMRENDVLLVVSKSGETASE